MDTRGHVSSVWTFDLILVRGRRASHPFFFFFFQCENNKTPTTYDYQDVTGAPLCDHVLLIGTYNRDELYFPYEIQKLEILTTVFDYLRVNVRTTTATNINNQHQQQQQQQQTIATNNKQQQFFNRAIDDAKE